MIHFRHATSVAVLLLPLLFGCGQETVDSDRDPVYFSPIEAQTIEPKVFEDPGPSMAEEQRKELQPVLAGFRRNARRVLAKPDIGERISQIESIFVASGHIFELADIYQNLVAEDGAASPAAPRLAWILLQLGQEKQARMWIDRLMVQYPGRASSWYLDTVYHLPKLRESTSAAARVVYGWNRVQSEDTTELSGFGDRQMKMVGNQASRLEAALPEGALTSVEEEITDLLSTPLAELDTPPALKNRTDATPETSPAGTENASGDEEKPPVETQAADAEQGEIEGVTPDEDESEADSPELAAPTPPADRAVEKREPIKITVARGKIALSSGDTMKAVRAFQTALEREPEHVEALLGMARARWQSEDMRDEAAASVRKLAARDDLTPRQTYEVGLFAFSKLDDNKLARELWQDVMEDDAALAKRVGLEEMLEKTQP